MRWRGGVSVSFLSRHGTEQSGLGREHFFLPVETPFLQVFSFFFFLLRFVESIYIQIYPVKVEKEKKGQLSIYAPDRATYI